MANLNFFAAVDDHQAIVDFILSETDARIFEAHSESDQKIREFKSFQELDRAYRVGTDNHHSVVVFLLQLWSPSVVSKFDLEHTSTDAKAAGRHKAQYSADELASMQLYLEIPREHIIAASHFGHNSEKRARNWGYKRGVNWETLEKISNKIQRHIRNRLAVAKAPERPVLPAAYDLFRKGYALKEHFEANWQYEPVPMPAKKRRSKE
jgi:hypothetical protein